MSRKKKFFVNKISKLPASFTYIKSTFNNTFVNLAGKKKNTLFCLSAGCLGFKGAKKRTPFAARTVVENVLSSAYENGIRRTTIIVKGCGPGRDAAIRAFQKSGIKISQILDQTPISYNGCRPPLKRRT